LHSAEAYARSLETTLQERESAFRNAEAYAHSLEEELQRQQAAFTELETYTRSLIAAHHGEAEVPQ
jgi:hypothetical protein